MNKGLLFKFSLLFVFCPISTVQLCPRFSAMAFTRECQGASRSRQDKLRCGILRTETTSRRR